MDSEKELEIYCISQQKKNPWRTVIGTVFNNFKDKLPASLDYKLRFSSGIYSYDFETQRKYRMYGPNYYNAYKSTLFLGWQACVEQTFINHKMEEQGKSIDYRVWMQRFPYPEHKDNSGSTHLINIVSWCICYGLLFFVMNIVRRVIEEKANGSKEFRTGLATKLAVNNVSLNIYEGQITALLGHNGAGKTTTINILTGLYTPTSGTASINGLDILRKTTEARRGLGVCPQHNVLYDTLTVDEHLKIYAAMKGVPWNQLTSEATQVLNILKLTDKRNELVKALSGGMKRKLSLAIAIVGGSKVLFLDEPSSGLDVEARRSVWDALLEIRHNRTIILTTHYMEEADILGDRIAIMAEGEIQCCGSPMFLKQKFGTGYHLHVVKHENFDLTGLTNHLKKYIPEVSLGNELEREISFNLSTNTGSGFGEMFEELENHKEKLGVLSFGITITTMEDVFLNVANISDIKYKIRSDSGRQNDVNVQLEDVYGDCPSFKPHPRIINQFLALLMKCFHYSKRHWSVLLTQFALPFILMCLCVYLSKYSSSSSSSAYDSLKLDVNSVYGKTDGFFYSEKPQLSSLAENLKNALMSDQIRVKNESEPTHYVLKYGKDNLLKYLKNFIVGGAIDQYSNKP
ncbi:ATP-binding cassette sub-family A member 3 [Araneus ventricosus]|uniref:ATP-binding cassette sub-family A member 3 n=1 Tax=Araneus ventricosus TaxID=182803 RepID=A0A4Y2LDU5_ARAVE|nr:ATP-binding cassette sub-family A member 3 [Araneus ventricosus]